MLGVMGLKRKGQNVTKGSLTAVLDRDDRVR